MESSDSRFDDQQMSVELRRIELDAELRRAELQEKRASREAEEKKQDEANVLKQKELDISAGRGVRFTAAQATVVAAALALVSGAIGGGIQAIVSRDLQIAIERLKADASIELQRQQFESTLILDITKNVNLADRLQNLKFFVGAGLIADKNRAIFRMVQNEQAPFAPASQGSLPSRADSGPGCSGADGWTYSQSSGLLCRNGEQVATGYSGYGDAKNNPKPQDVHGVGVIPQGAYIIGPSTDTELGSMVMTLTPDAKNRMFGRSGFLVHGDNASMNGSASMGSIILVHSARALIASSPDRVLHVVP